MDVSMKKPKCNMKNSVSSELQKGHIEAIADALPEGPKISVKFCSEDEFTSSDISLKVEGVGRLSFPTQSHRFQKLLSASEGGQIPAESVLVLLNRSRLEEVLDGARSAMGFADTCHLEAEQGNMVIHRGDRLFRLPYSTKFADVIGCLVVVLPIPHRGGDVVIQLGTEKHTFVSENLRPNVFRCVSFLADCTSVVEQVMEGFFVAITYKLVIKSKCCAGLYINHHLICAIEDYFNSFTNNVIENKFVCMLDHNYTECSLKWHILRGEDQLTGSVLLAVAEALRLVPYLALVEIKYVFNHLPGECCVNDSRKDIDCVRFLKFVDSKNEQQADTEHIRVRKEEICWKESSLPFEQYGTHCEGSYVRNCAAVVMWSSSMSSELQRAFNYPECRAKLRATMKSAGKEKRVCEIVNKYGKYFYGKYKRKDFLLFTEIALYVKDEDFSMHILSPFKWDVLNCNISKSFALLETQYGTMWGNYLLDKWKFKNTSLNCDLNWVKSYLLQNVHLFVSQYLSFGGSSKVVKTILNEQLRNFVLSENLFKSSPTELGVEEIVDLVSSFLISSISISSSKMMDKIMRYLVSNPLIFTYAVLFKIYSKLKGTLYSSDCSFIEPLKIHVKSSINLEIKKEIKIRKNWLVKTGRLKCSCRKCRKVNVFLLLKMESVMEITLSQKNREHVENHCRRLNIPVSFTVVANQETIGNVNCPITMKMQKVEYGGDLEGLKKLLKELE